MPCTLCAVLWSCARVNERSMRAARVLHTAGVSHHFAGDSLILTRELIYPLLRLGQPLLQTKKKVRHPKRKKNAVSSCCARSIATGAVADNNVGALGLVPMRWRLLESVCKGQRTITRNKRN